MKPTTKQKGKQPNGRWVFANKSSNKELTFKTYKELIQLNTKQIIQLKNGQRPWPGWLSWLEPCPVAKRWQVQFPVRAPAWVAGLIPGPGA